jgi:hypothetical protein
MSRAQIQAAPAAPKRIKRTTKYPLRAYAPSVWGKISSTQPRTGMKIAPPRKGKKLTTPTEVPAILTGKSSLVVVNPMATMDEAQREKIKNRQ